MTLSLREQLDEARERIRRLETAFCEDNKTPLAWKLTPSERRILSALASRAVVSNVALQTILDTDYETVKSHMYKLRKTLRAYGITIETRHAFGYLMTPEMKARLQTFVEAERV